MGTGWWVVKVRSRIAGIILNDLPNLYPCRVVNKATSILYEQSLPLFNKFCIAIDMVCSLAGPASRPSNFCALLPLAFLTTQGEVWGFFALCLMALCSTTGCKPNCPSVIMKFFLTLEKVRTVMKGTNTVSPVWLREVLMEDLLKLLNNVIHMDRDQTAIFL